MNWYLVCLYIFVLWLQLLPSALLRPWGALVRIPAWEHHEDRIRLAHFSIEGQVLDLVNRKKIYPTPPLTAKPLKWQMHGPPECLHLAPAVDIFKVNI